MAGDDAGDSAVTAGTGIQRSRAAATNGALGTRRAAGHPLRHEGISKQTLLFSTAGCLVKCRLACDLHHALPRWSCCWSTATGAMMSKWLNGIVKRITNNQAS